MIMMMRRSYSISVTLFLMLDVHNESTCVQPVQLFIELSGIGSFRQK